MITAVRGRCLRIDVLEVQGWAVRVVRIRDVHGGRALGVQWP